MEKDCPLDLNPDRTDPRESVEFVESDVLSEGGTLCSESNQVVFIGGHPAGNTKQ